MSAFVDYCRKQASKYGIKGSRLDAVKRVLEFLNQYKAERLGQVWDGLPNGEFIFKHNATPENNNLRMYEVCGRKFSESVTVEYIWECMMIVYDNYGARAKAAQNNENIDWKALSHAVRAAKQLQELYRTGNIIFPLADAEMITAIKTGKMDYTTEVAPMIERDMDIVEKLSAESSFPKTADREYWDNFILGVY